MARWRWLSSIVWSKGRSFSRLQANPIAPTNPKARTKRSERSKHSLLPNSCPTPGQSVTSPLAPFRPPNWHPFSPPPTRYPQIQSLKTSDSAQGTEIWTFKQDSAPTRNCRAYLTRLRWPSGFADPAGVRARCGRRENRGLCRGCHKTPSPDPAPPSLHRPRCLTL